MNGYLLIVFLLYILTLVFSYRLEYLNLSYLKRYGSVIPPEFEGEIDREFLDRSQRYSIENTRFNFVSSVFKNIIHIAFFFCGLLGIYNQWFVVRAESSFIISGFLFFLILTYAETLLSLPFNLYHTFRIENRFGFSTTTPKLWVSDLIKSILVSTVLLGIVVSCGLYLVKASPQWWWLWLWGFFFLFSVFIMFISPYVIEPLFNKFTPLENDILEKDIRAVMEKVGIKVSRIFKMDASKRTRHTNAYFTGIGKVKRIVLYDTLIEKMNKNEIIAVLAHELGHWKKKHILKRLIVTETVALIAIYLAFILLKNNLLSDIFNIENATFFAKVIILGFLGSIAGFPFTPLVNYFSRRHENEADRFSCELTHDKPSMISALVKLSKDNLSNLHPHPLYARFYYSHPPVLERIRFIKKKISGSDLHFTH